MIIQTGMRTDIPAFYSEWFANRIRDGYVMVRNPYQPLQVTQYSLNPEVVDLIGFCSKNPTPMLKYMELLKPYGITKLKKELFTMDVRALRTQQEIIARRNMTLPRKWVLGIDAGFSSLKGIAPNKYFCFPSFVQKVDPKAFSLANEKDILYRDDSGTYLIGTSAQNQ